MKRPIYGVTVGTPISPNKLAERITPADMEAIAILVETGIVDPVSDSDGAIYTDNNGTIYVL